MTLDNKHAYEASFGGVDNFDYEHEITRDMKELQPKLIRDSLSDLMNEGRVGDAKEIYDWLEGELNNRQAWGVER